MCDLVELKGRDVYMEYLDIYDEDKNYLGKEERTIVHRDALWHNTVHCWLYDQLGNVYFQIRKDENKLYTTASGHVMAGETVKQGFGREVEEEIGIKVNYEEAVLVNIYKFILDKELADGTIFRDRAFSNVYVCLYDGADSEFKFDDNELNGLVKVNAKECLSLFNNDINNIEGIFIYKREDKLVSEKRNIDFNSFLVNKGETAIGKYGDILNKIISLI